MFAYVQAVPGTVVSVVEVIPSPLPEGQTAAEYHACGAIVESGWNFDGNSFTPPTSAPPEPSEPTLAELAQAALDKSDTTIIRCYSASVSVPSAWEAYRAELRAIVNGTDTSSTELPAAPSYPAGT